MGIVPSIFGVLLIINPFGPGFTSGTLDDHIPKDALSKLVGILLGLLYLHTMSSEGVPLRIPTILHILIGPLTYDPYSGDHARDGGSRIPDPGAHDACNRAVDHLWSVSQVRPCAVYPTL